MIDMKQIKENVSSKIKHYQAQDEVQLPVQEKARFTEKEQKMPIPEVRIRPYN